MFYAVLFLAFLYFKIIRVYQKEERVSSADKVQYTVTYAAIASLFTYGFMNEPIYLFVLLSLLFFIIASLIITAVQLGIFVNGRPLLGLTRIYRYLPALSWFLVVLVSLQWIRYFYTF
jgi:hypothetical protein